MFPARIGRESTHRLSLCSEKQGLFGQLQVVALDGLSQKVGHFLRHLQVETKLSGDRTENSVKSSTVSHMTPQSVFAVHRHARHAQLLLHLILGAGKATPGDQDADEQGCSFDRVCRSWPFEVLGNGQHRLQKKGEKMTR